MKVFSVNSGLLYVTAVNRESALDAASAYLGVDLPQFVVANELTEQEMALAGVRQRECGGGPQDFVQTNVLTLFLGCLADEDMPQVFGGTAYLDEPA